MKAIRIISPILLITLMALIFLFSSQTADESSDTSGRIISAVFEIVYPDFDELDSSQKTELIGKYQFIARKGAHLSIYALLGVFSFFTYFTYTSISYALRFFLSSATCLAYSVSDEFHQTFIAGRSGELRDICIDFCGSLISILFLSLIFKTKFKGEKKMQRKELLKINEELMSENRKLNMQINDLRDKISAVESENKRLLAELEGLNSKLNSTTPLKKLEEKISAQADITEDTQYGSTVIGQIVVSAAKHCNSLSLTQNRETAKELVNLILGRTEVAKAEILKIISSDITVEEKKAAINSQKQEAEDYFQSVIAQIK